MINQAKWVFQKIGSNCATKPWEVIFSCTTLTVVMISFMDWYKVQNIQNVPQDYLGADIIFMTVLRCSTLLYTYHQFQSLYYKGSTFILGFAILLVSFSSFVYCCAVMNVLEREFAVLKDAFFFFLLLIDLKKASYLAQFALASSSYHEVQENIAEGLSILGPTFTLDVILKALLFGSGALSGVSRIEEICGFAVLAILLHYLIFLTFYPACISLVLELSSRHTSGPPPPWQLAKPLKNIDDLKYNPVKLGVKIIMSAGLFLVHGMNRWLFDSQESHPDATADKGGAIIKEIEDTDTIWLLRWMRIDYPVLLVILVFSIFSLKRFGSKFPTEEQLIQMSKGKVATPSELVDVGTQTKERATGSEAVKHHGNPLEKTSADPRPLEECIEIFNSKDGVFSLTDKEILLLAQKKNLPTRTLENTLKDSSRAVRIRRKLIATKLFQEDILDKIPYENYDYSKVKGQCCENVIGYTTVPLGVAGPLKVNGREYMIPMATTEGALVASTSRGCKALRQGVNSYVFRDGMSRAPVVEFPNAGRAVEAFKWIKKSSSFAILKESFEMTSNYAKLINIDATPVVRNLFIRFVAGTGDAMGMNMVAKGTEAALKSLQNHFPDMQILSISGNYCTDKKPSAINWILGRGKSVICDAVIPEDVVRSVLKTSVKKLVDTNIKKNLVGSAMAASVGGNNAHAANIVTAMFLACGQDIAQVVESSSCLTYMEASAEGDLYVSVTMPSLEVGTVGGGTALEAQIGCLQILGVQGPSSTTSGEHASELARIVAAAVMAGEVSLMASLTEQSLVKSHLALNRKQTTEGGGHDIVSPEGGAHEEGVHLLPDGKEKD